MPADRFANEDSGFSGTRAATLWALAILFVVAVWLWLAFLGGGHSSLDWAFPAMALGVAGVVVASLVIYPRRPRQLSLAVLALFSGYALWVLASNLWAGSTESAWQAAGRTFLYLLAFTLAATFLTSPHARSTFRYLLMAASFVLLVACIWRLWTANDLTSLLPGSRFAFPVGQANGAAALFLVPFWPLIWLAAGPEERAPVRGVAVGIATGLMGLALMTQSRGAAWSLGISLVVLFAISPGRVRLLFYLVVPALLMVYAFPTLNQYWTHGPAGLTGGVAARTLTVAVLAGGFMGMIVALLEKWVKVSGRMKAIFGAVVLAGCAAGLVYGSLTLTQDVGGPLNWFERTWQALVDEPAIDSAAGAGLTPDGAPLSNPTRADMWEAAWQRLQSEFLLGTGADNSAFPGASGSVGGVSPVAQPDSLVLETIGETGVIGGVLLFGGMLLSVIGIMWPRTGAGWRSLRKADRVNGGSARASVSRWGRDPLACGWEMALLAAVVYWFVHANMERLWLMTGVTLPALLMLAAALAATDARARTMWPRLSRRLRRGPVGGKRSSPEAEADARAETDAGAREASPPRAAAARSRARTRLQPEGPLSDGFRIGLMVLSAATVILAVPAYLFELL